MTKARKNGGLARFVAQAVGGDDWIVFDRHTAQEVAQRTTRGLARRNARQQNRAYHPAPRPKQFYREA